MKPAFRKSFWFTFLPLVLAVYFLGIYPTQHRMNQCNKAERILKPLIAANPRFIRVRVVRGIPDTIAIGGNLQSESDLNALKQLIEDAHLPINPILCVKISSDTP